MKKLLSIVAFAAIIFSACNRNEKPSADGQQINQDSIDKLHGHSHEPEHKHVIVNQDSIDQAHGHSHDVSGNDVIINQDSIDKAHGHSHSH
ncbi:MAG: hypothetical protein U0U66_00760 [Cytophagaceae bacterium]